MNYYNYYILKRNDDYLALFTNINTQNEMVHYFEQGYVFVMSVNAFNATSAINIAKQNEHSEIGRLQAELSSLRQEYQKMVEENNRLRFGQSFGFTPQSSNSSLNPLHILGFDTMPQRDELKKRYRSLSHKYHPDKDGSNLIMQIIQEAYESLDKQIV